MRLGSSVRPLIAVKRAGSMPSARRSPISRYSSAVSLALSFSSTIRPLPVASTRISQLSGRFSVSVAVRRPSSVSLPCAPGPTPA